MRTSEREREIIVYRDNTQQWLDIQIVRREDNLEQHLLVHRDELLVPFADISCPFAGLFSARVVCRRERVGAVMFAVLEYL